MGLIKGTLAPSVFVPFSLLNSEKKMRTAKHFSLTVQWTHIEFLYTGCVCRASSYWKRSSTLVYVRDLGRVRTTQIQKVASSFRDLRDFNLLQQPLMSFLSGEQHMTTSLRAAESHTRGILRRDQQTLQHPWKENSQIHYTLYPLRIFGPSHKVFRGICQIGETWQ